MRLAAYAAASLVAIGILQSATAYAQSSDSVVMRRALDPKTRTFAWVPGEWSQCSNSCGAGQKTRSVQCMMNGKHGAPEVNCGPNRPVDTEACYDVQGCSYTWQPGEWTDVAGCGQVVETRKLTCLRGDGETVSNDQCPAPTPDTAREVRDLRTCSYAWKTDAWSPFSSECQTAAVSTRTVWCERSNGEKVSDAECSGSGAKPEASQTENRYGQCGYTWKEKAWTPWSSTCQTAATRTREVVCLRSNGDEVADGLCVGAGAKPATSETGDQYGSCTYSWKEQAWGAVVPACGASSRARAVQCVRSNGDVVADGSCDASSKPATSEAVTDYQTCTYSWNPAAWSAPSTTCGSATSTRTVTCLSSDGRTVGDASCAGAKPEGSKTTYETSGCSYSWNAGAYSAPVPACGATVQNRSVTCLRSDGQTVADASCPAGSRPASQQAATDYSTCTYGWTATSWGAWSSSCGTATQARSVTCQSSDGRTVADSFCGSSAKPAASQDSYQTAGCARTWTTGAWSASDLTCTAAAVQTRSVTCMRSDGQAVADAECSAAKPAASQTVADYSGCTNYWVPLTGFSDWNSHCSSSATRTRNVSCIRNEWRCDPNSANLVSYHPGASTDCARALPDSSCSAATMPPRSETSAVYDQCGYTRVNPTAWSGWDNACSGSANRTRTYQCQRSDGTIVAGSECTSRGISLTETETGANYTNACPGYFSVGGWTDYNSHCSASATRTRNVTCYRSGDNVFAGDQYCTDRGVAVPARSETTGVYDGCGYSWSTGAFGAPTAACGASTQYRSVWCTRSDGTTVADGYCNAGTRPAASQGVADYSACTYAWAYNGWGTTSQTCGSVTQTRAVWCRRADGTTVADGYCGGGRPAATQTYADYSACTYDFVPGAWSDWNSHCSDNARRARAVWCYRSDGTMMDPDHSPCYNAGKVYPGYEQYAPVYDQCGYTWQQSGYSVPSGCGSVTATQDVWCQRSDGARVADGSCGGGRPSNTTQTSNYSACGYTASYGGWSACSGGSQSREVVCTRSDGVRVDAGLCGLPNSQSQGCQSSCYRPTSGSFYVDRGVTGGQSFTSTTGSVRYTGTTQNNYQYSCGRSITGRMTVRVNGTDQTVASTCYTSASSPGSCSQQTTTNIGGENFTVWTRISSFNASWQDCTIAVSLVSPPPAC